MDSNLPVFIPMEDFPEEMVFQELQAFPYQAISNSFFLRDLGPSWVVTGAEDEWTTFLSQPLKGEFSGRRRSFEGNRRERERLIQSFLAETWALLDIRLLLMSPSS